MDTNPLSFLKIGYDLHSKNKRNIQLTIGLTGTKILFLLIHIWRNREGEMLKEIASKIIRLISKLK